MIRRLPRVALSILLVLPAKLHGQIIRGHTEHTVCPSPFRPVAGLTFHAGKAWAVTFHTFPYQYGFAQYSALPDPATSDDGEATWTHPGASVECTNTWFLNPDGSVAYVVFNWHIISYRGEITTNGEGCKAGDGEDPVYMNSYDPYAPAEAEDDPVVQGCHGGGSGGNTSGDGLTCWWEWMEIEISYDGGLTWESFWSGLGQVCQQQEA